MLAERGREFLDTNILVYAHDTSAGAKRHSALTLLGALVAERRAAISIQVLQELFVTLTGPKLPTPLGVPEATRIIADLSVLTTHAPTAADVLMAVDIHQRHSVSFWDAMVIRSAARLGCTVLWSEDLADGQDYDGVIVHNPFSGTG